MYYSGLKKVYHYFFQTRFFLQTAIFFEKNEVILLKNNYISNELI